MSTTSYLKMLPDGNDFDDLMKSLTNNFNILADEVQLLGDRKTVLEHKLRFAHEQYQHLADKYAPSDPEISNTLAKLQLPPELNIQTPDRATFVLLPSRRPAGSKQQTAEAIRDGRRASQKISILRGWRLSSESGGRSGTQSISGTTCSIMRTSRRGTSATTILEQDFTVPGKESKLLCPFTKMEDPTSPTVVVHRIASDSANQMVGSNDKTPHQSTDPICAALYAETHSSPPPSVTGSAAKCPIRYLDQHSPEEVAKYFETHKHEIPRSHEVCVKRYQRNEEDIRKLDAKYGNLVSMISGLGQKHQPMLPLQEEMGDDYHMSTKTNERVENWAKAVSSDGAEHMDTEVDYEEVNTDRKGRFDRPMKEVRLGESPSRPWGIAVPFLESPQLEPETKHASTPVVPAEAEEIQPLKPAGKCPFGHSRKPTATPMSGPELKAPEVPRSQPAFLSSPDVSKGGAGPQMVFTGPVFIGYPIEQAMALMAQWQAGASKDT